MKTRQLLLLLISFFSTATHAANLADDSPYTFSLNAGFLHDYNVTRATLDNDILSDNIANLGLGLHYQFHHLHESIIILTTKIDVFEYQDFTKLSNINYSAGIHYRIKPNHGYTAPWYQASLEYKLGNFKSTLRDNNSFIIQLMLGKRITDRINLHSGLIYENVNADATEFDLENKRLYFNFDYKINTTLLLPHKTKQQQLQIKPQKTNPYYLHIIFLGRILT